MLESPESETVVEPERKVQRADFGSRTSETDVGFQVTSTHSLLNDTAFSMRVFTWPFFISLVLHVAALLGTWDFGSLIPVSLEIRRPVEVVRIGGGDADSRPSRGRGKFSTSGKSARSFPARRLDLRPSFAREGIATLHDGGGQSSSQSADGEAQGIRNPIARDLLLTESKTVEVFDLLASRIDRYLDYPSILAENGVSGAATLELFFDREGRIDFRRSALSGDSRVIRGLLARASRKGLVEWYENDAIRIRKDQFRDQVFRADFILTGGSADVAELTRGTPGHYEFTRRRYIPKCIAGTPTGEPFVDLACVGTRIFGIVRGKVDSAYQTRFEALKEALEQADALGLSGLRRSDV